MENNNEYKGLLGCFPDTIGVHKVGSYRGGRERRKEGGRERNRYSHDTEPRAEERENNNHMKITLLKEQNHFILVRTYSVFAINVDPCLIQYSCKVESLGFCAKLKTALSFHC